jgi:Tol biopolymer transport system component
VNTLAWRPDGEEIWFSGARGRQRTAINGISLNGGAVRLVYDGPGSIRIHDVSAKGRSLVSVVHPRGHVYLQGLGIAEERSMSLLDWATSADLSADGKTLLFLEWGEGVSAKPTIYLRNTDGSDPVRLGEGKPLALSPDGKWVVAIENATPPHLILLPTGAGEPRQLPRGSIQEFWWAAWFADGKRILLAGNESDRPRSYVQDIDGGEPRPILRDGLAASLVLPDGKRVVAQNVLDGSHSLWPLDGGDPERIPGIRQEEEVLAWTPDGKSFWLRSNDAASIKLYRVDASTGRRTLWKEIRPPSTGMAGFAPERGGVRITPDGKAWVYSYWRLFHELYLVDGLR